MLNIFWHFIEDNIILITNMYCFFYMFIKICIVFLVMFCDEIIGSKNHRENSLSFSLLKSESVNLCFVRKH